MRLQFKSNLASPIIRSLAPGDAAGLQAQLLEEVTVSARKRDESLIGAIAKTGKNCQQGLRPVD